MDDILIRLVCRLVRVHEELGEAAFETAANRALVSIARSVQLDAEARAGVDHEQDPQVVQFPLDRAGPFSNR
ncbi:MAG: hypothetical protein Devi2KO_27550 [Devosia indica]